jgi:hypothetical protein
LGAVEVIMEPISSQSMLAEMWRLEIVIWKLYSFSILLHPKPLWLGTTETSKIIKKISTFRQVKKLMKF